MHVKFRLPYLAAVLLLGTAPLAGAQETLPDPVAPAVIGRPLDQIRPVRPKARPAAQKPTPAPQQLASTGRAVPAAPPAPVAAVPAAVQDGPPAQRAAKLAVDDRADPRTRIADDVGKGTRFASKPLGPGAYFSSRHQALVRKYYEANPAPGRAAHWRIGEPVPPRAALAGVPDGLRAALPAVPPGHQYVQLDGDVVLLAVQSRMVVDGVSRSAR